MNWKVLGIAIFAIVLFGLIYYFNYEKEAFVDAASVYIVESSLFPVNAVTTTYKMKGYSLIKKVQEDFPSFVTNYSNYAFITDGGINRVYWAGACSDRQATLIPIFNTKITDRDMSKDNNVCDTNWIVDDSQGTWRTNLNNFIGAVQSNSVNVLESFLYNSPYYNISVIANSVNPNLYLTSHRYDLPGRDLTITSLVGVNGIYNVNGKDHASYGNSPYNFNLPLRMEDSVDAWKPGSIRNVDINYPQGIFRGRYTNPNLANADNEVLQLNVYGSIDSNTLNDFKASMHWGAIFDFSKTEFLDLSILIPWNSKLNGKEAYYSHCLFKPELVPTTTIGIYKPADGTGTNPPAPLGDGTAVSNYILFNSNIINCYNSNTNTIYSPANFDYTTMTGIHAATSTQQPSLQQQFTGSIDSNIIALMPSMLHRYITSFVFNRTNSLLNAHIASINLLATDWTIPMIQRGFIIERAMNNLADCLGHVVSSNYNINTSNYTFTSNYTPSSNWSNYLNTYIRNTTNFNQTSYVRNNLNGGSTYDYGNISNVETCIAIALSDPGIVGWTWRASDKHGWFWYNTNWNGYGGDTTCYCGSITRLTPPTASNLIPQYVGFNSSKYFTIGSITNSNICPLVAGSYPGAIAWEYNNNNTLYIFTELNAGTGATSPNGTVLAASSTFTKLDTSIMLANYETVIQSNMILPNYGLPMNVLDSNMLNQLAQSYYDYSEGSAEMTMIYDVYRIGSNMLDVRFDSKQHLDRATFTNIQFQYSDQIAAYNRINNSINEGTWVNSYSNITDAQLDLSNALAALQPVFNPIYPVGGGNVADWQALQIANSTIYMAQLNMDLGNTPFSESVSVNNLLPTITGDIVKSDWNVLLNIMNADTNDTNYSNLYTNSNLITFAHSNTANPSALLTLVQQNPVGLYSTLQYITTYGAPPNSTPATSELASMATLETQLNSTINADATIQNIINGITTSVARFFISNYSYYDPPYSPTAPYNHISTIIKVNGMVLGTNATLSYNNAYNGNIQTDMGMAPGNVNYQPTINYDYNINPVIQCIDPDFIQQIAAMFNNETLNSLSTITSNQGYNPDNGYLYIDKVFAVDQLDDTTCGFTWQETQYDPLTNRPTTRIANVVVPFVYDNSIYENPQLLINNGNMVPNNSNTLMYVTSQNITTEINIIHLEMSNLITSNGVLSNYSSQISNAFYNTMNGVYVPTTIRDDSKTIYTNCITNVDGSKLPVNIPVYYIQNNLSFYSQLFNTIGQAQNLTTYYNLIWHGESTPAPYTVGNDYNNFWVDFPPSYLDYYFQRNINVDLNKFVLASGRSFADYVTGTNINNSSNAISSLVGCISLLKKLITGNIASLVTDYPIINCDDACINNTNWGSYSNAISNAFNTLQNGGTLNILSNARIGNNTLYISNIPVNVPIDYINNNLLKFTEIYNTLENTILKENITDPMIQDAYIQTSNYNTMIATSTIQLATFSNNFYNTILDNFPLRDYTSIFYNLTSNSNHMAVGIAGGVSYITYKLGYTEDVYHDGSYIIKHVYNQQESVRANDDYYKNLFIDLVNKLIANIPIKATYLDIGNVDESFLSNGMQYQIPNNLLIMDDNGNAANFPKYNLSNGYSKAYSNYHSNVLLTTIIQKSNNIPYVKNLTNSKNGITYEMPYIIYFADDYKRDAGVVSEGTIDTYANYRLNSAGSSYQTLVHLPNSILVSDLLAFSNTYINALQNMSNISQYIDECKLNIEKYKSLLSYDQNKNLYTPIKDHVTAFQNDITNIKIQLLSILSNAPLFPTPLLYNIPGYYNWPAILPVSQNKDFYNDYNSKGPKFINYLSNAFNLISSNINTWDGTNSIINSIPTSTNSDPTNNTSISAITPFINTINFGNNGSTYVGIVAYSYVQANLNAWRYLNAKITNARKQISVIQSVSYIPIFKSLPVESTLDNADGACPVVDCRNSTVMMQLLDQYNADPVNLDRITRVLKGTTPNSYQCDYLVETIPVPPALVINTCAFGSDTVDNLLNLFYPTNYYPDIGTGLPFNKLNIKDPSEQIHYAFSYIANCSSNYTQPDLSYFLSNYYITNWFPGYNYIYFYMNSASNIQYQKLKNLPAINQEDLKSFYSLIAPQPNFYVFSNIISNAFENYANNSIDTININGVTYLNNIDTLNTLNLIVPVSYIANNLSNYKSSGFNQNIDFIWNAIYATNDERVPFEPGYAHITPYIWFIRKAFGVYTLQVYSNALTSSEKTTLSHIANFNTYNNYNNKGNVISTTTIGTIKTFSYSNIQYIYFDAWASSNLVPLSYITSNISNYNVLKSKLIKEASDLIPNKVPTHDDIHNIIMPIALTYIDLSDPSYLPDDELPYNPKIVSLASQQTKSFPVALNIADCSYVYYSTIGTGYFIQDNTPAVQDTGTDISGLQYVPTSLGKYYNTVTTLMDPIITSATNVASLMYNAFSESRLATYVYATPLLSNLYGESNTLQINNTLLTYNDINNLLSNTRFVRNIFDSYASKNSFMKDITHYYFKDNILNILFDRDNLTTDGKTINVLNSSSSSATFQIITTPGYNDYTPVYINETLKISLEFPNIIPAIMTPMTVTNTRTHFSINPLSKKIISKLLPQVSNDFISGIILTPDMYGFKLSQSYYLANYSKTNDLYVDDIIVGQGCNTSYNGYVNMLNSNSYLATTPINNIVIDFSVNTPINFNDPNIKSLTNLQNIISYKAIGSNSCEYSINFNNENIPFSKKFFIANYYIDNLVDSNSQVVDILSVKPSDIYVSQYVITPIINQDFINIARNYYNIKKADLLCTAYTYSISGRVATLYFSSYNILSNAPVFSSTFQNDIYMSNSLRKFNVAFYNDTSNKTYVADMIELSNNSGIITNQSIDNNSPYMLYQPLSNYQSYFDFIRTKLNPMPIPTKTQWNSAYSDERGTYSYSTEVPIYSLVRLININTLCYNSNLSITFGATVIAYDKTNNIDIFASRSIYLNNLLYINANFVKSSSNSNIYMVHFTSNVSQNPSDYKSINVIDNSPYSFNVKDLPWNYIKFQPIPYVEKDPLTYYTGEHDTSKSRLYLQVYNDDTTIPFKKDILKYGTSNSPIAIYFNKATIITAYSFITSTPDLCPILWNVYGGKVQNGVQYDYLLYSQTTPYIISNYYPAYNYQSPKFSTRDLSNISLSQAANYIPQPLISCSNSINDPINIFSLYMYDVLNITSIDSYIVGKINYCINYLFTSNSTQHVAQFPINLDTYKIDFTNIKILNNTAWSNATPVNFLKSRDVPISISNANITADEFSMLRIVTNPNTTNVISNAISKIYGGYTSTGINNPITFNDYDILYCKTDLSNLALHYIYVLNGYATTSRRYTTPIYMDFSLSINNMYLPNNDSIKYYNLSNLLIVPSYIGTTLSVLSNYANSNGFTSSANFLSNKNKCLLENAVLKCSIPSTYNDFINTIINYEYLNDLGTYYKINYTITKNYYYTANDDDPSVFHYIISLNLNNNYTNILSNVNMEYLINITKINNCIPTYNLSYIGILSNNINTYLVDNPYKVQFSSKIKFALENQCPVFNSTDSIFINTLKTYSNYLGDLAYTNYNLLPISNSNIFIGTPSNSTSYNYYISLNLSNTSGITTQIVNYSLNIMDIIESNCTPVVNQQYLATVNSSNYLSNSSNYIITLASVKNCFIPDISSPILLQALLNQNFITNLNYLQLTPVQKITYYNVSKTPLANVNIINITGSNDIINNSRYLYTITLNYIYKPSIIFNYNYEIAISDLINCNPVFQVNYTGSNTTTYSNIDWLLQYCGINHSNETILNLVKNPFKKLLYHGSNLIGSANINAVFGFDTINQKLLKDAVVAYEPYAESYAQFNYTGFSNYYNDLSGINQIYADDREPLILKSLIRYTKTLGNSIYYLIDVVSADLLGDYSTPYNTPYWNSLELRVDVSISTINSTQSFINNVLVTTPQQCGIPSYTINYVQSFDSRDASYFTNYATKNNYRIPFYAYPVTMYDLLQTCTVFVNDPIYTNLIDGFVSAYCGPTTNIDVINMTNALYFYANYKNMVSINSVPVLTQDGYPTTGLSNTTYTQHIVPKSGVAEGTQTFVLANDNADAGVNYVYLKSLTNTDRNGNIINLNNFNRLTATSINQSPNMTIMYAAIDYNKNILSYIVHYSYTIKYLTFYTSASSGGYYRSPDKDTSYTSDAYFEVTMNLYGTSCDSINISPKVDLIFAGDPTEPYPDPNSSTSIFQAFITGPPISGADLPRFYRGLTYLPYSPPEQFKNYEPEQESISYFLKYLTIESTKPFNIHSIQLFDKDNLSVPVKITRKDNSLLLELDPTEIIGFSFVTSTGYHPESWTLKGSAGKKWFLIEKRKFKSIKHSLYQMPIFYFNGETKVLPQPKSIITDKPKESKEIDTTFLQKYYIKKINPSRVPNFKKHYVDNDTYYYLYDEYDLNKRLVSTDLIIGFVVQGKKVKRAILYEDENGGRGFDLRNKEHRSYWDTNIMIDPGFFSPSSR